MALDLLRERLTECTSVLESLRDGTRTSLTERDKFWTKGVAANLDEHLVQVSHLRTSLDEISGKDSQQNVIDQAHDICDTISQAALQYEEQGLQVLTPNSTSDTWLRVKAEILEPSMGHIADQLNILADLINLLEQDPKAKQIKKKLDSLNIQPFQRLFEERIKAIDPNLRKASFSPLRTGGIRFEDIGWFWETVCCPKTLYRQRRDKADGILIKDFHVEKTQQRLYSFQEAWLNVNNTHELRPSDDSVLRDFVNMARIICVLRACSQHAHLNTLLRIGITDRSLKDEDLLDRMKRSMHDHDAELIFGEFSRVRRRQWTPRNELILRKLEPIPLVSVKELRGSSASSTGVYEVYDAWDVNDKYAHKIVLRDDYEVTRRERLDNEIKRLRNINEERHGHHIVECVKTYRRGENEIGMLLLPVADTDLAEILSRCSNSQRERRDYWVHLIKACGCLAYAMCYLHNVKDIRHYDVKPGNVLVCRATAGAEPLFLWADFGLAFGFNKKTGFTGSSNQNYAATAAYETPDKEVHTRAHDVYGLGCIILEIVSVLSLPGVSDRPPVHQFRNYKDNLPQLREWIEKKLKTLSENKEITLRKLLLLAQDMILKDRKERPKIHKVVERLRKIDTGDPSVTHPFCHSCVSKIKRDLSNRPQHPKIFSHESSGRSTESSPWRRIFH